MVGFTDGQLAYLESRARYLLITLKAAMGDKDEYNIGYIMAEQKECYSMGYSTAMDDVHSTPWEFLTTRLSVKELNEAAKDGWELFKIVGPDRGYALWRRRKAVGDGEANNKG